MIDNCTGIYIHVPFCGKKCPYCDFFSVPFSKNIVEKYVDAVLRNIRFYKRNMQISTIYFGGGTPSLLTVPQIKSIIDEIRSSFVVTDDAEITLEANPMTLDFNKLKLLRQFGVNRISVGVQSMNDSELKMLGRLHSADRASSVVMDADKAGFENISCDLMIGLPNQTIENIIYSIKSLSKLPITHISSYILKVEEGTPFFKDDVQNRLPDDDAVAEMYLAMCKELKLQGFMQYEISNFSKKGYQSRHNNKYWRCIDYLGIGPAAHSCFDGKRFAVCSDIMSFIENPIQQIEITEENPYSFEEYAMLALRLTDGIEIDKLGSHLADIMKKVPILEKNGYLTYNGKKIALTEKGFLISNSIIENLIFE